MRPRLSASSPVSRDGAGMPQDHVHEPLMRMEHSIYPALKEQVANEVAATGADPLAGKLLNEALTADH